MILVVTRAIEPANARERQRSRGAIYVDPTSTSARAAFGRGRHRLVDKPHAADLLWIREAEDYGPMFERLAPFQLLNHLPNERALSDKGCLAENLYAYDRVQTKHDLGVSDLVPETYCLYIPEERARFFERLLPKESKENLWILKLCTSSSGDGVRILWQFDEVREFYARVEKDDSDELYARYVIQRYIENPLLLEGRKSEIRIYWLVASLDPLLVLLYREGTVRLNTLPFELDDFDNALIHVTNVAQQEAHPNRDASAILKWSFRDWERYLVDERKLAPNRFLEKQLKPRLKRMLSFAVDAASPVLAAGHPEQGLCFALYGADIILDDNLHPWLTEVQEGPGLGFEDPIKERVIPPMLDEAAAIMLEVARRKREGRTLKKLDAASGFEWVVNEA